MAKVKRSELVRKLHKAKKRAAIAEHDLKHTRKDRDGSTDAALRARVKLDSQIAWGRRMEQERDDARAQREIWRGRHGRVDAALFSKRKEIDGLEQRIQNQFETIEFQLELLRVLKRGAQILRTGHVKIRSARNALGNERVARFITISEQAIAAADAVE